MLISILVDPSQIADERLDDLTDQSNTLERWDNKNVHLLFKCYQKLKGLLGRPNNTKKSVFNKIAEEFNLCSDLVATGEQCLRKWKKLKTKHKEIENNNKQTGRARKTWKFQKEMEECIGGNASVRPVVTFDTGSCSFLTSVSSPSSSAEIDDDGSDDDDGSESFDTGDKGKRPVSSKVEQRKSVKRKRKSHSSASEMLEFLREYGEKRGKLEEEKINLSKSLQQKKEFFGELLSCLKGKK